MRNRLLEKLLTIFSSLLLVFQSLFPFVYITPAVVFAQDATPSATVNPTPTPTDSVSPTSAISPTLAPTDTSTPTPIATITPTLTPTDSVTPIATSSPTLTPTDTATVSPTVVVLPTVTSTDTPVPTPSVSPTVSATGPPTPTPTQSSSSATLDITPTPTVSVTPTATTAPTITPQASVNGSLAATVLKNVKAGTLSLNLDPVNIQNSPTLTTNKSDYSPTDTVIITGENFLPKQDYTLLISSTDPPPVNFSTKVTTTEKGSFVYAYQLDGNYRPNYTVQVKDSSGTAIATTTFTDSPCNNACLDQYDDIGVNWQNGDLNSSNYREGDSVPYRMLMGGLSTSGSHTLIIQWDTTKGGKHALDYITSFNRTVGSANPCDGVLGCGSPSTFSIPNDPNVTGAGVIPVGGSVFTIYKGTITGLSSYTLTGSYAGDSSTSISITFTTTVSNPVIAWGGHIGSQIDWGLGNSASAISGSPYHTRLISLDGQGGNQDRALKASAILPTPGLSTQVSLATITIGQSVKDTATYAEVNKCGNNNNSSCGAVSGTTQFYVCGPGSAVPCTSTSNPVGGPVTNSGDSATSISFTPGAIGTYCFAAYYAPDANAQYSPIDSTTITNECVTVSNPPTGTLTVHKVTNPVSDTTTQFSITVTGSGTITAPATRTITGGTSQAFTVTAGTYSVTEAALSGWSEDYSNCQTVSVTAGGNSSCTITNTKLATVTIVKITTGADGTFGFTTSGGLSAPFNVTTTGNTGSQVFNNVTPGTYGVTENVPANWTLDSSSCTGVNNTPASFTVPAGGNVTCTFNDTAHGTLKIIKNTLGGSGDGTFNFTVSGPTASTPSLTTSGGTANTGNISVVAGTYSVSELVPAHWSLTSSSCTDGINTFGTNGFSIGVGKTVTCTFNDTKLANIIINKVALGGDATFGYTTTGGLSPSTFNITTISGAGSQSFNDVNPGTYGVTENSPPVGWSLTSSTCDNSNNPSSITINAGTTVTCTFTNTLLPTLKVIKSVTNDNGGNATSSSFTIHVKSSGVDVNGSPQAGSSTGTVYTLNPGTYSVSEDDPTSIGYSFTGITGGCNSDGVVTLFAGQNKTCTLTNDDIAPSLTLLKTVNNDNGGTALVTDWTLTATGASGSPTNLSGVSPVTSGATFKADTYTLAENSGPSGYAAGTYSCVKNGGDPVINNTITLGLADSATCTINNDDITAHLKLVKQVTKDDGGTAVATDWTLTASGPTSLSGNGVAESDVNSGTYTLSESGPFGYLASAWTCVGGAQDGNKITLTLGQSSVCSITNDDIQPQLIVVKQMNINYGGTKLSSDFTIHVTGTNVSPSSFAGSDLGTTVFLNQGSYSVTEDPVSGYSGSFSADCSGTINVGETKTCTVTNSDQPGTLIVKKVLVNDDGGAAVKSDFNFLVNGGESQPFNANGENDLTVNSGSYTVTENPANGYSTSYSNCSQIFVPNGASATCTITNDDIAPTLTLVKNVINSNGGTAVASAWVLAANAQDKSFSGNGPTVGPKSVFAGESYVLSESGGSPGYSASDWTCNSDSQDGNTITLALGENVTCTITNSDIAPTITLNKIVDNTNGGTASPTDFTLTVDGQEVIQGLANITTSNVPHIINEIELPGYQFVKITGDEGCPTTLGGSVTLLSGQNITCTITNASQLGQLKIVKNTTGGDGTFNFNVSGPTSTSSAITTTSGTGQNSPIPVKAGAYSVSEVSQAGWNLTSANCIDSSPNNFTIPPGGQMTCTFNNTFIAPTLTISKSNNAGGDKHPGDNVVYTITVKVQNNKVYNAIVTDLLPSGFKYRTGSWSANSLLHGVLALAEPHYASPGTWTIGTIDVGDTITLQYTADIDGSEQLGLYKDVAWGIGTQQSSSSSTKVLASAQNPGFVSTNFVGTQINVVGEQQQTTNVNLQGQVLGASTELPATGSKTIWMILATLLSVIGGMLVILGLILNKKIKLGKFLVILLFTLFFLKPGAVHASGLSIRLEQPKSPTFQNTFNITFVALDNSGSGNPISVQCFKKSPTDGSFAPFGSAISVSAGGNTGNCVVDGSVVSNNGAYQFYATATTISDAANSSDEGLISVDYNTSGPGTPTNYTKTQIGTCAFRINFHTASDGGKTVKVELYRSSSTSFTADAGTRVNTLNIGSNQDGQMTDSAPDCSKTWYYVIRAFDSAGNGSGIIGDTGTTTVSTTTTTGGGGGAIPVQGVNLPGGQAGAGQTLGTKTGTSESGVLAEATTSGKTEEIKISPAPTKGLFNTIFTHKKIAIVIILILSGVIYVILRKRQEQ